MERDKSSPSHPAHPREKGKGEKTPALGRRAALTRLGLIAGAAYVGPSLVLLKRGHAYHKPWHGGGGGSGGGSPPWSQPSKPSKGSRPSRPSR